MWDVIDQLERTRQKENSEVADRKVNCKKIIKGCCIGCVSSFLGPVQLIYIAYANKS